jgi:hypothetical protein
MEITQRTATTFSSCPNTHPSDDDLIAIILLNYPVVPSPDPHSIFSILLNDRNLTTFTNTTINASIEITSRSSEYCIRQDDEDKSVFYLLLKSQILANGKENRLVVELHPRVNITMNYGDARVWVSNVSSSQYSTLFLTRVHTSLYNLTFAYNRELLVSTKVLDKRID